ncbi:iron-hydroxamate ABC transporter substrate-binding protein [Paenibacillus sp. IB182493]|uniref:Iron-hydroxamate ABC transporter substrate-binding protein n=2 Tax=Paenibacillus arenilitoris TaxID=2772299 RepID=A0A927H7Y8_9BACL|nr:iron-hydroxamate ABC transporter substrate-binding protein [Paenibacillus arenilitoris]MBD2871128.1 iron-hydroxamate ABC transporter substrate-binding protein [Paenibacillus arenilitoris]
MSLSLILAACGGGNENAPANNAANNGAANASASNEPAAAETPKERMMTDALGNEVTIPANPERVIASYLEDHLVALGIKPAAQWSVANGIQQYLQNELKDVPTIPYDLPFEAVTSFNPDLIIIGSNAAVEGDKYAQYAKIAPTYVLGDEVNADWRQALLKVGEVFGKSEEAQKALDDYEAKATEAKEKLQGIAAGQTVAAIWLVQDSFFVVSEKLSSGAVLYHDLGFEVPEVVKEISATGTGNWNAISLEKLAELDADHLFLVNSDKDSGSKALNDPIWQSIPAVKNGNLYEYTRDASWLYSGAIANSQIIDDVLESIVK